MILDNYHLLHSSAGRVYYPYLSLARRDHLGQMRVDVSVRRRSAPQAEGS